MASASPTYTFSEETHTYRDERGCALPSVTQALKANGIISFDGIQAGVLERKRRLGSLVHKVAELWDLGEDLSDFEVPEAVLPYLDGYVNFRNDSGFFPDMVEFKTLGNIYGMIYGMTLDRTGPIDGVNHILELKCGASSHPAWGVQLAAYDMGLHNKEMLPRVALQLGPQFSRNYKLHHYTEPADYQIWASALATTIWKMNKGLFAIEDIPEREVL